MSELPNKDVLIFLLETLKQQATFAHRQQGWLTALWETIASDAQLESKLKQHPLYDQGPQPDLRRTDVLIPNIDALIRRLKEKP